MNVAVDWRRYARFELDARAFGLVALFGVVIIGGLYAATYFATVPGVESVTESTSTTQQAAGGIGASVFTVVEASVLLAAAALFRRTPEWLQPVIRKTVATAFWMGVTVVAAIAFGLHAGVAVAILAYFVVHLADALGGYWILNDLFALGLAVYFAAAAGVIFGPIVIGVALVGLSVYDHVFANRKDWMFTLARGAVRWRIPGLFVVPNRLRLQWSELAEFTTDEDADPIGFAIGLGDLALPAAFVVALAAHSTPLAAAGVAVGILLTCLHLSWVMQHTTGGAGLPPLTAGALGGWVVAAAVGVVA